MLKINIPFKINPKDEIPYQTLVDILTVYEKGKEEDLKSLPNTLICDYEKHCWTTWETIFKIRKEFSK